MAMAGSFSTTVRPRLNQWASAWRADELANDCRPSTIASNVPSMKAAVLKDEQFKEIADFGAEFAAVKN
jgi:hypothetical protein